MKVFYCFHCTNPIAGSVDVVKTNAITADGAVLQYFHTTAKACEEAEHSRIETEAAVKLSRISQRLLKADIPYLNAI